MKKYLELSAKRFSLKMGVGKPEDCSFLNSLIYSVGEIRFDKGKRC